MKLALRLALAAALVFQGTAAAAMPFAKAEAASTTSSASMPCHGDEKDTAALLCCGDDACQCAAMCGAAALVARPMALAATTPAVESTAAPRSSIRGAFRLTPLRPPIALSA